MRLDDLVQRERLGNDRRELAGRKPVHDELLGASELSQVAGDLGKDVAADRERFSDYVHQRQGCRLGTERTVLEQESALRHCGGQLSNRGTADGVENDTNPIAVRQSAHLCDEVLFVSRNDVPEAQAHDARRFVSLRVSAIGIAPIMLAIWDAAIPTLLEAAGIRTVSPALISAMPTTAPYAVRYCIQTAAACCHDNAGGCFITAVAGTMASSPYTPYWFIENAGVC